MAGSYVGIGLMSGTSLDGLDLCCVEFTRADANKDEWHYNVIATKCIKYSDHTKNQLEKAYTASAREIMKLNIDFGHFLGRQTSEFIQSVSGHVDFVSSHGHTIFHEPGNGFTCQIGDGETLVSHLKCPLVTNFRNKDLALGGQGAPLAPLGDKYLFKNFDILLNFGGIANISVGKLGFDICVANMALNFLASQVDPKLCFDKNGEISRSGTVIPYLLNKLNNIAYFDINPPKSLGKEWFEENMLPLFNNQVIK